MQAESVPTAGFLEVHLLPEAVPKTRQRTAKGTDRVNAVSAPSFVLLGGGGPAINLRRRKMTSERPGRSPDRGWVWPRASSVA